MLALAGYEIGARIHQSQIRSIHRAVRLSDGKPVVIKTLDAEFPTRQAVAELRREFHIARRLQPVERVIRVLGCESWGNGNLALVMEPFGRSLADELASRPGRKLQPHSFLEVAIQIAETLGRVHELDVVHKNIEPHSILVDQVSQVRLTDFRISSELSRERPDFALVKRLEGALPYVSPEQTGRMNRDLDYRSDFYSLGVTLFELLTGRLPFSADSILEWVHCHISRLPPSPSEWDGAIPEVLSAIVLKLMAKNADDRYQSCFGLAFDLRRCLTALQDVGHIAPFALGQEDVSRRFQIPQKLYGREQELTELLDLFDRCAAGSSEICMVSGYSGIGKSALVNELSKPLVQQRGFLIQGKFDQFRRSVPYSAVAVALRGLVQQMLAETVERPELWRDKLNAALTPNASLLVELVPELESVIGPQPAVPELPATEAQNRFQLTVLNFIRAVTAEQPLVIFLDDLQFSDTSTLNLIRWLGAARDLSHLLIVGAYRSNEVDVGHPLRLTLNDIEEFKSVRDLRLRPLDKDSVRRLVADALHTDVPDSAEIGDYLHAKSHGNPFFLTELLRSLENSRAIEFAPDLGRWHWNMQAVRNCGLSGNVVEFLIANLRQLPETTQRVLQLAACIGGSFDLLTLSIIHEASMDETGEALLPALRSQLLIPLQTDYALVGNEAAGGGDDKPPIERGINPQYRFQHDRVQQAAYELIDSGHKQAVHLSIGRLMKRHAGNTELPERLIGVVGHLNQALALIEDPAEKHELARLNLAAGMLAQRSSAYEAALAYLTIGQNLLPEDAWEIDYPLSRSLATEYQQCAYLTARYADAESWSERLLAQVRTPLEKAEVLATLTRQYATTGRMQDSIRAAIMGLSALGLRFTDAPDESDIRRERSAVRRHLRGRRIAELIDAPTISDPAQNVAIRLLMEIFPAAFLSGSGNLFPYLVLKSVNLSLVHGNSPETAFAYAAYGMLLCGALNDPARGYEFGRLGVAMNDRFGDIALKSRILYVYAMFVHHWSEHWSTMTPWFRRGIEAGYQSGDMLYLAYSAQDCVIWDPRLDLETAEQEHAGYLKIVRDCKYRDSLDSGTLFLQMQRNLLGRTDGLTSMSDAEFDEQACVEGMRQRRFMTGIANYHIYKTEICYFHGQMEEALKHVQEQDRLIASSMSLPQLVRFRIVAFLTLAALWPRMSEVERTTSGQRMRQELKRMSQLARHCPTNFLQLRWLMEAEQMRLAGKVDAALGRYERAMEAARIHEFRRDEAMANELAARHLLHAGRRKAAVGYLRAAHQLYDRWGARRKVDLLEREFPQVLGSAGQRYRLAMPADPRETASHPVDSAALDIASVMKASQAISSEIVLEQLWRTTMRIMLENAGGQRGCFVILRDGQVSFEGLTDLEASGHAEATLRVDSTASVPMSIVHHVLQTKTPIVINEPVNLSPFARDGYLRNRQPQSLLCVPLVRHGRLDGALYMENAVASGVFTEDRIEVIQLLAAQASISVDNARLYEDQRQLIEAQRRFVPSQFLESLERRDIARVDLGQHVAKEMSVMFADLRGFTPLAERLPAQTVIALLNRYFISMEPAITEAGGFIDSFAGDGIKALFDTSPDSALRGAIAMWRALEASNLASSELGDPELTMGIGINTGPVVLGTVGSHQRIQCSVIGDTVNLASRIEQLTKFYNAKLLIGEHSFRNLRNPERFAIRMVDRVSVQGKNLAVEIYEVLDAEPPIRRAEKCAVREHLQAAIEVFYNRDFETARVAFDAILHRYPNDPVPRLFAERCERYLQSPPPQDWRGFERLHQK
jgi:predicted ATPase/class 3 adenylate cyclase